MPSERCGWPYMSHILTGHGSSAAFAYLSTLWLEKDHYFDLFYIPKFFNTKDVLLVLAQLVYLSRLYRIRPCLRSSSCHRAPANHELRELYKSRGVHKTRRRTHSRCVLSTRAIRSRFFHLLLQGRRVGQKAMLNCFPVCEKLCGGGLCGL